MGVTLGSVGIAMDEVMGDGTPLGLLWGRGHRGRGRFGDPQKHYWGSLGIFMGGCVGMGPPGVNMGQ